MQQLEITYGDLYDYIEGNYHRKTNRYSLELVEAFAATHQVSTNSFIETLRLRHGFADLEVLLNVRGQIPRCTLITSEADTLDALREK